MPRAIYFLSFRALLLRAEIKSAAIRAEALVGGGPVSNYRAHIVKYTKSFIPRLLLSCARLVRAAGDLVFGFSCAVVTCRKKSAAIRAVFYVLDKRAGT